ncbi:hypothetical protein ACFL59_03905 [Planctomycetota bacterium]
MTDRGSQEAARTSGGNNGKGPAEHDPRKQRRIHGFRPLPLLLILVGLLLTARATGGLLVKRCSAGRKPARQSVRKSGGPGLAPSGRSFSGSRQRFAVDRLTERMQQRTPLPEGSLRTPEEAWHAWRSSVAERDGARMFLILDQPARERLLTRFGGRSRNTSAQSCERRILRHLSFEAARLSATYLGAEEIRVSRRGSTAVLRAGNPKEIWVVERLSYSAGSWHLSDRF